MVSKDAKNIIFICIVVVLATMMVSAQESRPLHSNERVEDIKIYFPYDESRIEPTYMDNATSLQTIDSLLNNNVYISTLSRVEITTQSSPEGKVDHNEQLSQRRRLSLERYFTTKYPNIPQSLWSFKAMAENWDMFQQHLKEDPNLPSRDEVLEILDEDRDPDAKEWLIKKVDGGKTWLYIKDNILPSQRFGASVLFIPIIPEIAATPEPVSPIIEEPIIEEPIVEEPIIEEPIERDTTQVITVQEPTTEQQPAVLLALKTNLLLDLVTAINLGVEVPIGNKFSVVAEVLYPWWRSWDKNFTMQIESYHGELKYWLGERTRENRLTGWSVGAYGGWGKYDLQPFSEEGVQGDFYDVGALVSYSHSITKRNNLYLEYMIGVGYLSTKYNDYYMAYDTEEYGDIKVIPYPWMNHYLKSVLPTRCGVSLVWHINSKGEGGSR